MDQTANVQRLGTKREAKVQLKQQLAKYVGQQPESTQVFHGWMKRLELASMGLIAVAFIVAMYVSINWTTVSPTTIPIAWFIFAASATPTIVLIGLHAIVLKAFLPVVGMHTSALRASSLFALLGKNRQFVTGSEAVWRGWAFMFLGLLAGAFWGFIAYATWTLNWAMLEPLIGILGVVMGVGIAISILYSMFQKIFKTR